MGYELRKDGDKVIGVETFVVDLSSGDSAAQPGKKAKDEVVTRSGREPVDRADDGTRAVSDDDDEIVARVRVPTRRVKTFGRHGA